MVVVKTVRQPARPRCLLSLKYLGLSFCGGVVLLNFVFMQGDDHAADRVTAIDVIDREAESDHEEEDRDPVRHDEIETEIGIETEIAIDREDLAPEIEG